MRGVESEFTTIEKSTLFIIVPPLLPNNAIVIAPFCFAVVIPFSTFFELPLVEIPITMSPLTTKLSHCLLKTTSYE